MPTPTKKELINVLFVDDDAEFLKSAKQCLCMQGPIEIESAFSVDEALEKMNKTKTDVIVCDIQMPVTSGLEFLKMLRKENNKIPFYL